MTISILVIDDVLQNREHFEQILLQLGIYALLADGGEQGLKVLEQKNVDAIFLDYNMPGMNGFEFIAHCRALEAKAHIPIIMMSTDMEINEVAVKDGLAQAWLVKRATKDMVESVLKTLGVT